MSDRDITNEGVGNVVPLGLARDAFAGRKHNLDARRKERLAVTGVGKVGLEGAVVVGVADQDVLVPRAADDPEQVDDVGAIGGDPDEHEHSSIVADDARISTWGAGFDNLEVLVAGDVEEETPVIGLRLRARVLLAAVDHDCVVREGADRPAPVFRVGIAEVGETLAAVREKRKAQQVVVLMAVTAGKVEVDLKLVDISAAAETGVPEGGEQQGTSRRRGAAAAVGRPCVVDHDGASVGVLKQTGQGLGFFEDRVTASKVEVFVMGAVGGETVTGRVAVALEETDQADQAPQGLSVIAGRPLAPGAVSVELAVNKLADPVDSSMNVFGLAKNATGNDQRSQERRIHV